jgi:hypothetical protein
VLTCPPVYSNIGKKYPEEWASTILGILALVVTAPVYYFYKKGPEIRMKSKFAQQVAKDREKQLKRRKDSATGVGDEEKMEVRQERGSGEGPEEAIEDNAASAVENIVHRDMAQRE